ncbi:unnamed protein product [Phaeothamnion confervicola]
MEDDGVDQQARKEEADDGGEGNGGEAAATGEPEEMCFSARLDNAKSVTTLLSCLSNGTKKDQHARCEVSMDGLTFVVTSRAMSTQASGELRAAMFQAYDCEPGVHHFGINLITLLECLQVFGPSMLAQTSLSMSYHPLEGIFRLTLEEAGVFTSCEIRTLHEDDEGADYAMLAQAYRQHDEEGAIVMRSEYLKEPFQELADFPGASRVTFAVSQKAPFFQLSVAGSMGTRCAIRANPGRSSSPLVGWLVDLWSTPELHPRVSCYHFLFSRLQWSFFLFGELQEEREVCTISRRTFCDPVGELREAPTNWEIIFRNDAFSTPTRSVLLPLCSIFLPCTVHFLNTPIQPAQRQKRLVACRQ